MKKGVVFLIFLLVFLKFTYAAVPDEDADGVPDSNDNCPGSQTDVVDQFGCSCGQKKCPSDNNECTDDCSVVNGLPACGFENNSNPCNEGYCSGGKCVNKCLDVVCNSPPDAYCSDSMLISFSPLGTCNSKDGICSYTPESTNCQYGCKDGACILKDTCAPDASGKAPADTPEPKADQESGSDSFSILVTPESQKSNKLSLYFDKELVAKPGWISQLGNAVSFNENSAIIQYDGKSEVPFMLTKLGNSSIRYSSADGYIIELMQRPVIVKESQLTELAEQNEKKISSMSYFNPLKYFYVAFATRIEDVPDEITQYRNDLKREHESVKESIERELRKETGNQITANVVSANGNLNVLSEYEDVFNGFALNIGQQQAEKIGGVKGVKKVYPNNRVSISLKDSVPLIKADKVWLLDKDGADCSSSGKDCLTGKGIKIAIIDTGVDYTHPDLGGCFGNQNIINSGGSGSRGGPGEIRADVSTPTSSASCTTYQDLFNEQTRNDAIILTKSILASENLCSQDINRFNQDIKSLITQRRNLLEELIKTDPAKALFVRELPDNVVAVLTQTEKNQLLEQRGIFTGNLIVMHIDDFDASKSRFDHYLKTDDGKYQLFAADNLPVVPSGSNVRFNGLSIGNVAAVDLAQGGLELVYPPSGSPASENIGAQRTLVIVTGIGSHPPPTKVEEARALTFGNDFGSVNDYYIKNSFGMASLYGDVVGPYVIPEKEWCQDFTNTPLKAALNDADLSGYSRIIVAAPCTPCLCYGGLGTIGKMRNFELPDGQKANFSMSWDFFYNLGIVGHELGHNFGVHHGNLYTCYNTNGNSVPYSYECTSSEYGDPYTVMGWAYYNGHHNAPHKREMGWLSDDKMVTTREGTYLLKPLETSQPAGTTQMIRVPVEIDGSFYANLDNIYYTIELRSNVDYDQKLLPSVFNGITIRLTQFNEQGQFTYVQSNLLNPKSPQFSDFVLEAGNSFVDNINGYKISLKSLTSEGASVTIEQIEKYLPDFNKPLLYFDFENLVPPYDKSRIGFVPDRAGYTNGGRYSGAIPKFGGLLFDEENDFFVVGIQNPSYYYTPVGELSRAYIKKNNEFTISMWVNIRSAPSRGATLYTIGWHELLAIDDSGRVRLSGYFMEPDITEFGWPISGYAVASSKNPISLNKWHHIVGKYDGKTLVLYIDGVKVASAASFMYNGKEYPLNKLYPSSGRSYIGGRQYGSDVHRVIDEVKVYARALSDNEILELHKSFTPQPVTQACKVIDGYDFVNNDNDPMDDQGHGTHVAATAAGKGVLNGVAPDAKIYSYKVLDSSGSGSFSNVISGIERAVDPNKDGDFSDHVDIISMSLGASCWEYDETCGPDDPLSTAVDNAVAKGVVAVIAAGNSGPWEGTISSPGTARKAITVGATDKSYGMARFSSRGPVDIFSEYMIKPDVAAPGLGICAAQWQEAWASSQCIDKEHTAISGTSMATPHAAGAAALLLQSHPLWTPQEVKSALMLTAMDLGYDATEQGAGLIDVEKANNAKIVVSPMPLNSGIIIDKLPEPQKVTIKNNRKDELKLDLKTDCSAAHLNVSQVLLAPYSSEDVMLSLLKFPEKEGAIKGDLYISDGLDNYRVPFTLKSTSEVALSVKTETEEPHSDIIIADESLKSLKFKFDAGENYKFYLPSGKYVAYAAGDAVNFGSAEYLLMKQVEVPRNQKVAVTLDVNDAKPFHVKAKSLDGTNLLLYDWQKAFMTYNDKSCFISYYLNDPAYGDRTVYVSNSPGDNLDTDVFFKYEGVPSKTKPISTGSGSARGFSWRLCN